MFAAAGADLIPVPVDADGLEVCRLPTGQPVRLAYVTPSHQFPLGGVLPLERRLALLKWAAECGAIVVEDDYDSEFWYDTQPVEAVQGLDPEGRVVYIGTFSKVLFPSLRLGYLIVPPSLLGPLAALKFLADWHAPAFDQEVLAEFIAGGHFERHVRRARARNASRRAAMLEAFAACLGDRVEVVGANAGIHMVAWLRDVPADRLDDVIEKAAERGIGIYSVAPYFANAPAGSGLVLGYAGLTEREIHEGIRLLSPLIGGRQPALKPRSSGAGEDNHGPGEPRMTKRRSKPAKARSLPPPLHKGALAWVAAVAIAGAAILAFTLTRSTPSPAEVVASAGFLPTVENQQPPPGPAPAGMVWIPGGEFSMGQRTRWTSRDVVGMQATTDSRPVHRVVRGRLLDGRDRSDERAVRAVRERDGLHHGGRTDAARRRFSRRAAREPRAGSVVFHPPDHAVPLNDHVSMVVIRSTARTGAIRWVRRVQSWGRTSFPSCISPTRMRWRTRSGPASGCPPKRNGSSPRAAA